MSRYPFLKPVLLLCAVLCCFAALKWATCALVLSSFSEMRIEVEMDHDDTVQLFASPHLRFQTYEPVGTLVCQAGARKKHRLPMGNALARDLRLDLGEQPGTVRIHSIKFLSYFGAPVEFGPQDILDRFQGNEYVESMELAGDAALVRVKGHDQFITLQEPLRVQNFFIAWVLPLAHTFIFYLFLTRFKFREYPAFTDISGKISSSGTNYAALDGMRGLAALTVLGEHTGIFKGTGWLGILWFFCLSGFLLSMPFVLEPKRALSFSYMCGYIARRLKRVLPMFYVMITLLFLFRGKVVESFRHYYFVQADGVLWTVPQELLFYFWLPFIVAAVYLCCFAGNRFSAAALLLAVMLFAFHALPIRWSPAEYCFWGFFIALCLLALRFGGSDAGKKALAALVLLELTYISFRYLTVEVIGLYGNGIRGTPRIGSFLCGVMFAYLGSLAADAVKRNEGKWPWAKPEKFSKYGLILYFVLLGLALWTLAFAAQIGLPLPKWLVEFHPRWYPGVFSFLSGVLILLAVFAGTSRFSAIVGCLPLRAMGVVSFSFYLLHPLVIDIVKALNETLFNRVQLPHLCMFVIAGILTYILSTITYTWIERPFVRK